MQADCEKQKLQPCGTGVATETAVVSSALGEDAPPSAAAASGGGPVELDSLGFSAGAVDFSDESALSFSA